MKILIVNNNLKIGGIQKSLINLLGNISQKHEVDLFLFEKTGEYLKDVPLTVKIKEANSILKVLGISLSECKKIGIKYAIAKTIFVVLTKLFGNIFAIRTICKFERKLDDYDIAISFMQPSNKKNFYGGTNEFVIDRVIADKKIAFIHCDYSAYSENKEYYKNLYDFFDNIAFCSEACQQEFEKLYPQMSSKLKVVYNFHDINKIKLMAEEKFNKYDKAKYNIVVVSRVTYEKGVDMAIESLKAYIEKYNDTNICLNIVGDGAHLQEMKNIVENYKLESNIVFHGNQYNPYPYIKNADLLLHTSPAEAAPMIFGEAEILHTPILATKTISTTELIENNDSGIVVTRDVDEIINIINDMKTGKIELNYGLDYRLNLKAQKQIGELLGE